MSHTVLRLQIHGRVQGVGYRWAMVEQARRLGVCGWVRNRLDGSVEATVAGTPDAVQRLVDWAGHGPPGAAVSRIDACPAEGEFSGFEQRPTA